ncbi:sigma-54-dependent Fis family transcriptional regulator [Candidatus Desantisbacteria bacterium]|nr:sigma-54-dependent Fis family transcriptional regulator [Candidatus Desantisbacteria bacterium]
MSHNIQIKLLRLLQEREIERIGGRKRIKIDARFITATNVDLKKSIAEGKFREDLFFRLNEFSLHIPPLRERKEDIPLLMKHFLDEFNLEFHKEIKDFTPKAHEIFLNYSWYGNVRELKNVIKRAVLLAEESIDIRHIPIEIVSQSHKIPKLQQKPSSLKEISRAHTEAIEKNLILAKLNETHWNKRKTATMLNVDYKTLFNKIKRYHIE